MVVREYNADIIAGRVREDWPSERGWAGMEDRLAQAEKVVDGV